MTRLKRQHDPCPVCFEDIPKSKAFTFPCAHVVCTSCNDRLVASQFLSCPTCREPREGFTRADVDAASSIRTASERPVVEHEGRHYEVIFFRSESRGTPFDVLERASSGILNHEIEEVALDGPLGLMIQRLVNPGVNGFLAEADTGEMTAANSRPRLRRRR